MIRPLQPSGWSITRQGNRWLIIFENPRYTAEISMTAKQYADFVHESAERLGLASLASAEKRESP